MLGVDRLKDVRPQPWGGVWGDEVLLRRGPRWRRRATGRFPALRL